jgi:hypothetical protein
MAQKSCVAAENSELSHETLAQKNARELKELQIKQEKEALNTTIKGLRETQFKTVDHLNLAQQKIDDLKAYTNGIAERLNGLMHASPEELNEVRKQIETQVMEALKVLEPTVKEIKSIDEKLIVSEKEFAEKLGAAESQNKVLSESLQSVSAKLVEIQKTYEEKDRALTEHVKNIDEAYQKLKSETESKLKETADKKGEENADLRLKAADTLVQNEKITEKNEDLLTHTKPEFNATGETPKDLNILEIEIDPNALKYLKKNGEVFMLSDFENPQYSYNYKINGYDVNANLTIKFEEFVEICKTHHDSQINMNNSLTEFTTKIFDVTSPTKSKNYDLAFYVAKSGFSTVDDWLKTVKAVDENPEFSTGLIKILYLYHIQNALPNT